MANNLFNYIFKITHNAQSVSGDMGKLRASVERVEAGVVKMDKSFSTAFTHINNGIKTIKLDAVLNQVDRVANGLNSINKPGLDLNSNMKELQAITGVTGQKLSEIEKNARKSGIAFGTGAAGGVEAYKLILSQLSPEIAKVPKALDGMGKNVAITSKLMGNDQVAATELLTTAMNQYQVSLDDPIAANKEMARMMNVMAAAAKEGSAELPQQKQALEQSGMAAKAANVQFEETAAAIQVLDKAGKKGSEGGVALRNTLATLSQGRFLPKNVQAELTKAGVNISQLSNTSIPLAERLKALQPIMNDSALITALFGKENSNAALALMSGIPELERLTAAVRDTNSAQEQAGIIMESQAEKNARLQARVDDFKISLFNATGGLMGYASVLGQTAMDIGNLIPLMSAMGTVITTLASKQKLLALWTNVVSVATGIWSGIQAVFNAIMALNPIVWVVLAVTALIAAIVVVASKTEGWGKLWEHTVNGAKFLFKAYVESVKWYFTTMVNGLMIGINYIKKGWYQFKEAVGLGDSSENQRMIAKINQDTEARKKAILDGAKKVAEYGTKAYEEFKLAGSSLKWKEDGEKEPGISAAGIPGMSQGNAGGNGTTGGDSNTKTSQAIATGGTKHNYITINLGELIGIKANTVNGSKQDIENTSNETMDGLLRILAMAQTAGN